MTIDEEFNKFTHEVEEVFQEVKHEVEEVFKEVRHQVMILSVRDFSMLIAFTLMGITTLILIIGTVYVRCFHHPKHVHEDDGSNQENEVMDNGIEKVTDKKTDEVVPKSPKKKDASLYFKSKIPVDAVKKSEKVAEKTEKVAEKSEKVAEKVAEKMEEKPEDNHEQNGQVRKRTTSSSASVNNNDSPVKSKIPVRQKSVTKSP